MRKAIRTTIDENLLNAVKDKAKEENCNVNDILEEIIRQYILFDEMNDEDTVKLSFDSDVLHNAVKSELIKAIMGVCKKYHLTDHYMFTDFVYEISDSIATAAYMSSFYPNE